MKKRLLETALAASFAFALILLACADLGRDNPLDPGSGKYNPPSSSAESSSSSGDVPTHSSSSVVPSSSGEESSSSEIPSCSSAVSSSGGSGSSSSDESSSSAMPSSSSSSPETQSSSSGEGGTSSSSMVQLSLCADFVTGTKREHYGMEKEQFCDERDGKKYVYVVIETQTWMAENLNYAAEGSKCGNGSSLSDSNTTTCHTYGRLYNWATAMGLDSNCNSSSCSSQIQANHIGICPSGWHIPSAAEWNTLMKFVKSSCRDNEICDVGTNLKSTTLWSLIVIPPTDDFGFSALPGGYGYSNGYFSKTGSDGYWWSTLEYNANLAYIRSMQNIDELVDWSRYDKNNLLSVRCLKD